MNPITYSPDSIDPEYNLGFGISTSTAGPTTASVTGQVTNNPVAAATGCTGGNCAGALLGISWPIIIIGIALFGFGIAEVRVMAAVIVILAVLFILMARAKANPLSGATQSRVQQLVSAISGIEGGSLTNPGNIRDSFGNIAESADLTAKINFDFVLGESAIYSPDMTFTEFAWMYVAGTTPGNQAAVAPGDNPDNWAAFVAGQLGVSVDSSVGAFLTS